MHSIAAKLTILTILTATVSGCGKSAYEAKMTSQYQNLAFGSRFIDNLHVDTKEVIPQVASIRLPTFVPLNEMRSGLKEMNMTSKNQYQKLLSPDRVQPPGMRIPGFRFSYEQFVDIGDQDPEPVYWYFAAVPASAQSAKALESKLRKDVGKTVPKSKANFVTVDLDTPDRTKLSVRKLSAKGKQLFNTDQKSPKNESTNGQFDLYLYSTNEHHVIIGIRGTTKALAQVKGIEHASFAMGTLEVTGGDSGEGEDA